MVPFTVYSHRRRGRAYRRYAGSVLLHPAMLMAVGMVALAAAATVCSHGFSANTIGQVLWVLVVAMPFFSLREFVRRFILARLDVATVLVLDIVVALLQVIGFYLCWWYGALSASSACGVIDVTWVVLGATGVRADEARRSAELFLRDAGAANVIVKGFRDSFVPCHGEQIKEYFHELQAGVTPDIVFTHRRDDLHQDHRLVNELTWNTFRNHLILEYEIPKYEGDLGAPNVFMPIDEAVCRRKVDTIVEAFATQQSRAWFDADTFWALLRIRGVESNSPSRFAEGLYGRKLTLTAAAGGALAAAPDLASVTADVT